MSAEIPKSRPGDPTWEIVSLFPSQGEWTAVEYLGLETNHLIELNDGKLEFLSMPTELHQLIVFYICMAIRNLDGGNPPGVTLMAPFKVQVASNKFREPDVVFMLHANQKRRHANYWEGADLVIEVVSSDDPKRDLETKKVEYAAARITEYWIVDPRDKTIRVLTLEPGTAEYREAGYYSSGNTAASLLLPNLQIDVSEVFNQPMVTSM